MHIRRQKPVCFEAEGVAKLFEVMIIFDVSIIFEVLIILRIHCLHGIPI